MQTSGGPLAHFGAAKTTQSAEEKQLASLLQGQYQIVRKLGAGGMGSVYQARHIKLDSVVAIKVVSDVFTDAQALKRLRTEAQALALISHPNIVGVLNLIQISEGQLALVMEYVDGEPLETVIQKSGALRAERVRRLFVQCAEALVAAHSKGIIHRDLKPSNILVTTDGAKERVKVLDFGIAKFSDGSNQKLTKTGMIVGSPAYMSPEQACGAACEPSSDIYSLGCVFYQALSGTPPFEGETAFEVLLKHSQEDIPRLEIADQSLASIISKCTQRDPKHRFQNAQELLDALNALNFEYAPIATQKQSMRVSAVKQTLSSKSRAIIFGATLAIIGALGFCTYEASLRYRGTRSTELSPGVDVRPKAHQILHRLNHDQGKNALPTDLGDLMKYDSAFSTAEDLRYCANVYYEHGMPERGFEFRARSVLQEHRENSHDEWETQKLALDTLRGGDAKRGEKFLRDQLAFEIGRRPYSPVFVSKCHWNLMCFGYLSGDKALVKEMHSTLKKELKTPDATNMIQRWMTSDDALFSEVMKTSPKFGIDLLYI